MERLVIAAIIVAVAAAVAFVSRRRRIPDAPTQQRYRIPDQIDRADFAHPEAPWLVTVFSSATCDACAAVVAKARVLESSQVAVAIVEFDEQRAIHEKYEIDAVPTLLISDADGVTRNSFQGPVNATDMWAAVAEVREPGSAPGH